MDFTPLKECLNLLIKEDNVPGLDCFVYKEHELVFRYYTGMSDIENGKKMNGNELYLIFSMTKMITCTCALQLFEQGKFLMNDRLSKYLPEFEKMEVTTDELDIEKSVKISNGSLLEENLKNVCNGYAKNDITIKDLFTMCAGFDYNLKADGIISAIANRKTSTKEIVRALSKSTLGFEPGTRFRYSLCHDVLGALIEIWSGMNFGEYMKKNLLDPLEMKKTFFGIPKDKETLSQFATRYTYDENRKPRKLPLECVFAVTDEYESGGAGLVSCPSDYAIFLDALANGGVGKNGNQILKPSTVELMHTNQLRGRCLEDFYQLRKGYGYGLGVRTHLDPTVSGSISPVGEFGWDGAAGGFSLVDTKNRLSLTYFQHIHGWDVGIQNKIRNALYSSLNI